MANCESGMTSGVAFTGLSNPTTGGGGTSGHQFT